MKSRLYDLILPAAIILGSFILISFGLDGEMKSILGAAAGWAFGRATIKI